MGNRNTYPAYHNSSRNSETRGRSEQLTARGGGPPLPSSHHHHPHHHHQHHHHNRPFSVSSHGAATLPLSVNGSDQTTCPQCQRVLLVPLGAPLFRCPCGVLFRTETIVHHRPQSDNLMGRAVMCRRCRRLSMAPLNSPDIVICQCGSPALPLNDVVMSLLAEGELGIASRGGIATEAASHDMIEMLPTATFTAASKILDEGKPRPEHGDDVSCRVCFEDYLEGDEQRVLPCFHKFHKECIDEWLGRKKLCPLCNTSIDIILRTTDQYT